MGISSIGGSNGDKDLLTTSQIYSTFGEKELSFDGYTMHSNKFMATKTNLSILMEDITGSSSSTAALYVEENGIPYMYRLDQSSKLVKVNLNTLSVEWENLGFNSSDDRIAISADGSKIYHYGSYNNRLYMTRVSTIDGLEEAIDDITYPEGMYIYPSYIDGNGQLYAPYRDSTNNRFLIYKYDLTGDQINATNFVLVSSSSWNGYTVGIHTDANGDMQYLFVHMDDNKKLYKLDATGAMVTSWDTSAYTDISGYGNWAYVPQVEKIFFSSGTTFGYIDTSTPGTSMIEVISNTGGMEMNRGLSPSQGFGEIVSASEIYVDVMGGKGNGVAKIDAINNTYERIYTTDSYWTNGCWNVDVPNGRILITTQYHLYESYLVPITHSISTSSDTIMVLHNPDTNFNATVEINGKNTKHPVAMGEYKIIKSTTGLKLISDNIVNAVWGVK